MQFFIKELGNYRGLIPKNTIKTLKGQALSGDLAAAKKGLDNVLYKMGLINGVAVWERDIKQNGESTMNG